MKTPAQYGVRWQWKVWRLWNRIRPRFVISSNSFCAWICLLWVGMSIEKNHPNFMTMNRSFTGVRFYFDPPPFDEPWREWQIREFGKWRSL